MEVCSTLPCRAWGGPTNQNSIVDRAAHYFVQLLGDDGKITDAFLAELLWFLGAQTWPQPQFLATESRLASSTRIKLGSLSELTLLECWQRPAHIDDSLRCSIRCHGQGRDRSFILLATGQAQLHGASSVLSLRTLGVPQTTGNYSVYKEISRPGFKDGFSASQHMVMISNEQMLSTTSGTDMTYTFL